MNPFIHALFSTFESEITDVTNIGETLAYTWFGRPNYAYSFLANKYWFGSTKDTPSGTTQHITEFDISTRIYQTTQVGSVFQKDDHNQLQILIRKSDNRLIVFYTEHTGSTIKYRISTNPLDASSWGAEVTLNPTSSYSYPSPYQASSGDIYVFYRTSTNPERWYYVKSTDDAATFGSAVEFFYSGYKCYLISNQLEDKIHFVVSNGHPAYNASININTYHFYFDMLNETAHSSDGTAIVLRAEPSECTPINLTTGNDSSWISDIAFKNNLPRVLYIKYPEGRVNNFLNKELWFAEYNGVSWINNQKIADTLSGYIEDDISIQELAYEGASRFNTSNADIIWMPKQVDGILEIHKVDMSTTPPSITQITFGSTVNNWRPISIPSPVNNLLWLKNNSYNMYDNYSISLLAKTV